MKFSDLRKIKEVVNKCNAQRVGEPIEFWFPGMFDMGCWGVTLVFPKVLEQSEIDIFIPLLQSLRVSYFIGGISDDTAIFIQ